MTNDKSKDAKLDASKLADTLETSALELNDATDIPSLETSLPELKLDIVDLQYSHAILGGRVLEVERLVFALSVLLTAMFLVIWQLRVSVNVGRY